MMRTGRVKAECENKGLLRQILQTVYRDFLPYYQVTRDLKIATAMGDTCTLVNRAGFRNVSRLLWTRVCSLFGCIETY